MSGPREYHPNDIPGILLQEVVSESSEGESEMFVYNTIVYFAWMLTVY